MHIIENGFNNNMQSKIEVKYNFPRYRKVNMLDLVIKKKNVHYMKACFKQKHFKDIETKNICHRGQNVGFSKYSLVWKNPDIFWSTVQISWLYNYQYKKLVQII